MRSQIREGCKNEGVYCSKIVRFQCAVLRLFCSMDTRTSVRSSWGSRSEFCRLADCRLWLQRASKFCSLVCMSLSLPYFLSVSQPDRRCNSMQPSLCLCFWIGFLVFLPAFDRGKYVFMFNFGDKEGNKSVGFGEAASTLMGPAGTERMVWVGRNLVEGVEDV